MPIYAYRCDHCGHKKDLLQKLSDPPLQICPSCGKASFRKQLTAAGFQLKGSGWYVTDFKSKSAGAGSTGATDASKAGGNGGSAPDSSSSGSADGGGTKSGDGSGGTAAAGGCGASCDCH
jgi:putative FmdB family regulatory protein